MRRHLIFLSFIVVTAAFYGCDKGADQNTPAYTSIDGRWTYTSPGDGLKVEFDLVSSETDTLLIQNSTVRFGGTNGAGAATIKGIDLPEIMSIRINGNDPDFGGTVPFIHFKSCAVTGDFSRIVAGDVEYTASIAGGASTLTSVTISRK